MKGHTSDVNCIAFSPDGKRLATVSDDVSLRLWNATTGQETLIFRGGFSQRIMGVAFSPDGTLLYAVGGPPPVPVPTRRAPAELELSFDPLRSVAR